MVSPVHTTNAAPSFFAASKICPGVGGCGDVAFAGRLSPATMKVNFVPCAGCRLPVSGTGLIADEPAVWAHISPDMPTTAAAACKKVFFCIVFPFQVPSRSEGRFVVVITRLVLLLIPYYLPIILAVKKERIQHHATGPLPAGGTSFAFFAKDGIPTKGAPSPARRA